MSIGPTTSATFERDVLQAKGPVLVDFWAPWCGRCGTVLLVLEEIQAEHAGKITILTVNLEECPDLALRYRITSIPAMKVFEDGAAKATIVGVRSKVAIERELASYLT